MSSDCFFRRYFLPRLYRRDLPASAHKSQETRILCFRRKGQIVCSFCEKAKVSSRKFDRFRCRSAKRHLSLFPLTTGNACCLFMLKSTALSSTHLRHYVWRHCLPLTKNSSAGIRATLCRMMHFARAGECGASASREIRYTILMT